MVEPSAVVGIGRDPVPQDSRYECLLKIASGGMATVYVGRLRGAKGFWRLVAIKRAHAHFVGDDTFRRGLIGEAKVASQIHHQNVVSVLDVEEPNEELLLIMDYVEGASLSQLISAASKRDRRLPLAVVVRVLLDAATGLHAAHELSDESGTPLHIVHRDVSPQNILVGVDGASRIADFGIARYENSGNVTTTGLKGKVGYMAPEYIRDPRAIDRRADVFALGVVAWEAIVGERLFKNEHELVAVQLVLESTPKPMGDLVAGVPDAIDAVVARALSKDPATRYPTALEFARDLEAAARAGGIDPTSQAVADAVKDLFGDVLDARRETLRKLLASPTEGPVGEDPGAYNPRASAVTLTAEVARPGGDDERTREVVSSASADVVAPVAPPPLSRWTVAAVVGGAAAATVAIALALTSHPTPPSSGAPSASAAAPTARDVSAGPTQASETAGSASSAQAVLSSSADPTPSRAASAHPRVTTPPKPTATPTARPTAPPANHPGLGY